MDYEELALEQENRTFFGKPVRFTTLMCYPNKLTYEEFKLGLSTMGVEQNLQSGEHFIEWWVELFMSYHEIEQEDYEPNLEEKKYKNLLIDMHLKESI